jgi:hypothetical protein
MQIVSHVLHQMPTHALDALLDFTSMEKDSVLGALRNVELAKARMPA